MRLAILKEAGGVVDYLPVSIDGLLNLQAGRSIWADYIDPLAVPKRAHLMEDIPRMANYWDIPLCWPPQLRPSSIRAMSLASLVQFDDERLSSFLDFGSSALWRDGHDLNKQEIFTQLLAHAGIADFSETDEAEGLKLLERNTKMAYQQGVFGVPSFLVEDRVYFGADRLEMLADRIKAGIA